jgi:hypothetical protein
LQHPNAQRRFLVRPDAQKRTKKSAKVKVIAALRRGQKRPLVDLSSLAGDTNALFRLSLLGSRDEMR